jgi:SEC-C motif domain protein
MLVCFDKNNLWLNLATCSHIPCINVAMKRHPSNTQICPCGSGKSYAECCQNYVEQTKDAPTAEALMRSRYSAFVLLNEEYLRYSWHPGSCPKTIHLNENVKWLGLKIVATKAGGLTDKTGEVEFVARSKISGKAHRLHERSQFINENNRWLYIEGKFSDK